MEGRDAFRASRARPGIRRGISRAIEKTADRPATNKDCAFYAGISTCSAANAPRSHASPRFARPRSAVPCLESTADRFRIQLQAGAAYAAATRLDQGVTPHFRTGDLSTLQEFNHGPNDDDDADDPQRKVRLREIVRGVGPHVAGSRDATTLGAPDFGRHVRDRRRCHERRQSAASFFLSLSTDGSSAPENTGRNYTAANRSSLHTDRRRLASPVLGGTLVWPRGSVREAGRVSQGYRPQTTPTPPPGP